MSERLLKVSLLLICIAMAINTVFVWIRDGFLAAAFHVTVFVGGLLFGRFAGWLTARVICRWP